MESSSSPAIGVPIERTESGFSFRTRSGSLRRRDIQPRLAPQISAMPPRAPSRMTTSTSHDEVWSGPKMSFDKDPAVSYQVTITAGNPGNAKAEDGPCIFERTMRRIIPSRTSNKSNHSTPKFFDSRPPTHKASLRPSLERRLAKKTSASELSETDHGRKSSVSSFARSDRSVPTIGDDAYSVMSIPSIRRVSPAASQKSSPMSKFNPAQSISRQQTLSPQVSAAAEGDPESSRSVTGTMSSGSTVTLNQASPEKRSIDVDSLGPERGVDASSAVAPVHPEGMSDQEPKESQVRLSTLIHGPPKPPPKDTVLPMMHNLSQREKGNPNFEVMMPGPMDLISLTYDDLLRLDGQRIQEPMSQELPSPQLRAPLQSTLAKRRHAVPQMLQLMAGSTKTADIHQIMGVILSPASAPVRKPSVTPASAEPLPLSILSSHTEKLLSKSGAVTVAVTAVMSPKTQATITDPESEVGMLIPAFPPTVPALPPTPRSARSRVSTPKSPRQRLTSTSGVYITSNASGQRLLRKKNPYRRNAIGFRTTSIHAKGDDSFEDAECETLTLPAEEELSQQGMVVQKPTFGVQGDALHSYLTPPQVQGEWIDVPGSTASITTGDIKAAQLQDDSPRSGAVRPPMKSSKSTPNLRAGGGIDFRQIRLEAESMPGITSTAVMMVTSPREHPASSGNRLTKSKGKKNFKSYRARAQGLVSIVPFSTTRPFSPGSASRSSTPISSNPYPASRFGPGIAGGMGFPSPQLSAAHKVTAEESIKQMMNKQLEQQEALRAKLLHPQELQLSQSELSGESK